MGMKELYHEIKITPLGEQISDANAAAVNAACMTNALDCAGFEANAILLYFADVESALDHVFTCYESDVSVTDAGTACAAADVIVRRSDGDVSKCPVATGVLTTTAAADEDYVWEFHYIGKKRWFRITDSVGAQACTPGMMSLQWKARRQPPTGA